MKEIKIEDNTTQYSRVIPLRRLFLLYFFTGGLYLFYWFYRNWRNLKEYNNIENVKPGWLTVGMIIPFYNIYLLYDLWNSFKGYSLSQGIEFIKHPGKLAILYAFVLITPGIIFNIIFENTKVESPISYFFMNQFVYILGIMIIVYSQMRINNYWRAIEDKQKVINRPSSLFEIIIISTGFIFFLVEVI